MITPVILAGGLGSRLWPLSRSAYPKQLLPLVSGRTMLQETVLRAKSIGHTARPVVICNQEHRFLVAEQLQEIGIHDAAIILEPMGKNTAPAAAIAALYLSATDDDPLMLVLPADHVIADTQAFAAAANTAAELAQAGSLVTFGIKPTHAEIGYGYIKVRGHQVEQFVEKPDLATAQQYLASGEYYWNSGMFVFKTSSFLAELEKYSPDIFKTCQQVVKNTTKDLDFIRLNLDLFAESPSDSIDYAVMEKTKNAALVPLNAAWSDVGSWAALWEAHTADQDGNVMQGDVFSKQVQRSYMRAESRMLAVIGVSDHIIVETADAVLVAHKDQAHKVKDLVEQMRFKQRSEVDLHRRVYRPWGHYEVVDQGPGFKVKRITVKSGAKLSLQKHHKRSEHWIVVSGHAEVTRDNEVFMLSKNESTYIPCGVKHKLANHSPEPLEIIEVQSGDYLGEDDIVRYEDVYGRSLQPA